MLLQSPSNIETSDQFIKISSLKPSGSMSKELKAKIIYNGFKRVLGHILVKEKLNFLSEISLIQNNIAINKNNHIKSLFSFIGHLKSIKSLIVTFHETYSNIQNQTNSFWNKYNFHNLKVLKLEFQGLFYHSLGLFKKLSEKFGKLDLVVCEFFFDKLDYMNLNYFGKRKMFYLAIGEFKSLTRLNMNFLSFVTEDDFILLASAVTRLRKLEKFSIRLERQNYATTYEKFFDLLRHNRSNLKIQVDFNDLKWANFSTIYKSLSHVDSLNLLFKSNQNIELQEFDENSRITSIKWVCAEESTVIPSWLALNKKLKRLKHLEIHFRFIKKYPFFDFIAEDNMIQKFKLSYEYKFELEQCKLIANQLKLMKMLEELSLSIRYTEPNPDMMKLLFESIKGLENLRKIQISHLSYSISFIDFITQNSNLRNLEIISHYNPHGLENLKKALAKTKLFTLKFDFCSSKISNEEVNSLFQAINEQEYLEELDLNFSECRYIQTKSLSNFLETLKCKNLRILKLNFSKIGLFKLNVSKIFENLANLELLKRLELDFNLDISKEELTSVTQYLSNSYGLKFLKLSIRSSNREGVTPTELAKFALALRGCKNLDVLILEFLKIYHIKMEDIMPLFYAIASLTNLTKLQLKAIINKSNPFVTDTKIYELFEGIPEVSINNQSKGFV